MEALKPPEWNWIMKKVLGILLAASALVIVALAPSSSAVLILDVEYPSYLCHAAETPCKMTLAAPVNCYWWNRDGSKDNSKCSMSTVPQNFNVWGFWFCPPADVDPECDRNGKPTDGTIDLRLTMSAVTVLEDCAEFREGTHVDDCAAPPPPVGPDNFADEVDAGRLFGGHISGTYGGFSLWCEDPNQPDTCA